MNDTGRGDRASHVARTFGGALLVACSSLAVLVASNKPVLAQTAQQAPTLPPVTIEPPKTAPKAAPKPKAEPAAETKAKSAPVKRAAKPATPPPAPVAAAPAEPADTAPEASTTPAFEGGKPAKAASSLSDSPLATQTTGEGLKKNEVNNIRDLGATTEPGVDYNKATDGPVIRGMDGPRVTTVVDGIPIPYLADYVRSSTATVNAPTNANGGGAAFDFFSISALDVLRGADSSQIGSGVLGGALVIRTIEPEDLITDGKNFGGLAKATYDSRDKSYGGGLAVAGRAGAVSVLAQGSYTTGGETENKGSNGAYGAKRTEPNPQDYDQDNILLKLRVTSPDGHRFGVTGERFSRETDTDIATNWNRYTTAVAPATSYAPGKFVGDDSVERRRVSLEYSYSAPVRGGVVDSAFATAYWQDLTKNSGADGRQRGGTIYSRDVSFDNETYGFVGGINGNLRTGDIRHNWRAGLDVSTFEVNQFTVVIPSSAFAKSQADIPKIDGNKVGVYLEDQIFLTRRFSVTPGVRFDWHEYDPQASPEYTANTGSTLFGLPKHNEDSRLTAKVRAQYQVSDKFELFVQWAEAYRAPTVDELYSNFTNAATGYAQLGNPNLKSETGQGVEIGSNFGDSFFGGRVTGFYNKYHNFIAAGDLTPDPSYPSLPFGVARFYNINEVTTKGAELKLHQRFTNGIVLHGGLAYTHGVDGDGKHVPTIAPFKLIAGIGYEQETWGIGLIGTHVGPYAGDNSATTYDAKAYTIADFNAWWEPTFIKGLRIQGTVKNLFDETYYDALALRSVNLSSTSSQPLEFYSAPGRSFILSATQKF